jgi:hypothetical protein
MLKIKYELYATLQNAEKREEKVAALLGWKATRENVIL